MPDKNITELKNYLNNLRIPFLLCFPAKNFLNSTQGLAFLNGFSMTLDNQTIRYNTLAKSLQVKSTRDTMITGFEMVFLKTVTADSFEAMRKYCEYSGQSKILKSQPWYQFFRMVRNALSHDYVWTFNDYDKSILPVSYNGKTIEKHMDGTLIRLEFFNSNVAWHLLEKTWDFVTKTLK